MSVEEIHEASKFDPWFLRELSRIVDAERAVAASRQVIDVFAAQTYELGGPLANAAAILSAQGPQQLADQIGTQAVVADEHVFALMQIDVGHVPRVDRVDQLHQAIEGFDSFCVIGNVQVTLTEIIEQGP